MISIASLIIIGLVGMICCDHLIKKLLSLAVMQAAIILLYIAFGYIDGAGPPILPAQDIVNPLPQVLMLTAIVVGLATMSVGLAIAVNIKRQFGSNSFWQLLKRSLANDL